MLDLSDEERASVVATFSLAEQRALLHAWEFWARPEQLWRPGEERDTFYLAGRGWGKTRVGTEAVRWMAKHPELCAGEIAIAGRTAGQRNRDMLYGTSGIMSPEVMPDHERPLHRKADNELVWTTGAAVSGQAYSGKGTTCRARLMSGDVPASFRGPGYGFAWTDELPHWKRSKESWENLEYTMRESSGAGKPCTVNTTTPIPTPALLEILFECDSAGRPLQDASHSTGFKVLPHVRIVHGSSYDNAANLAPDYFLTTIRRHEGSRLADQEVRGMILLDVPGALWRYSWIRRVESAPKLEVIGIGVDPAGSAGRDSAETGIIGAGRVNSTVYMLDDRSGLWSPREWALEVIRMYDRLGADFVVCERDYGGDMVRSQVLTVAELPEVIMERRERGTTRAIKLIDVNARGSKRDRARVVCGLWEQGWVKHVGDPRRWVGLEHQLTHTDPAKPHKKQRVDRLDAAVHIVRHLVDETEVEEDWEGADDPDFWRRIRDGIMN